MDLVCELILVAAKYDFCVSAAQLVGKKNLIANALSQFNLQEFFQLVPKAHPLPKIIPEGLQARLTSNIRTGNIASVQWSRKVYQKHL